MTWIDLGNPSPKKLIDQYIPIQWQTGDVVDLPCPRETVSKAFLEVLDSRQSIRCFDAIDEAELGEFLWHACRTRKVGNSNIGFELEHRAAPSAGSIHPIHVILKKPKDSRWWLYQPQVHRLAELTHSAANLAGLDEHAKEVLQGDNATLILLLAEPGKTLGKYQDGCSLIWRDVGVLLGVMSLVAEAQGLAFCPLGVTGEPWAGRLAEKGKLAGVGLAFIGSSIDP